MSCGASYWVTPLRDAPATRQVWPDFSDHIGNTGFAYCIAATATYAFARAFYTDPERPSDTYISASATLGGGALAQAANVYVETPMFAAGTGFDTNTTDVAFGIAGALLGAYAISSDRVRQQLQPSPDSTYHFLPGYDS